MPGTLDFALTVDTRRRKSSHYFLSCVCLSVIATSIAGLLAWILIEGIVAEHVMLCFDRIANCQVVASEFIAASRSSNCSGKFVYKWQLPDSETAFIQEEEVNLEASKCAPANSIGLDKVRFSVGIHPCFRVKDHYAAFTEYFNCADVLAPNNAEIGPCQTLFPPASSYEGGASNPIGIVLLVLECASLLSCCYLSSLSI